MTSTTFPCLIIVPVFGKNSNLLDSSFLRVWTKNSSYPLKIVRSFTNPSLKALQTHHVDSTLKRCGNDRFHVVSTWNPRGVFVGCKLCLIEKFCIMKHFNNENLLNKKSEFISKCRHENKLLLKPAKKG